MATIHGRWRGWRVRAFSLEVGLYPNTEHLLFKRIFTSFLVSWWGGILDILKIYL